MAKLHPKILALRNSLQSKPILFANKYNELPVPSETRASKDISGEDDRVIRQYHCLWGVPDDYGTMPVKGCFSKSIKERGPNSSSSYKIPALYYHRLQDTVGLPTVLEEDEIGLYSETPMLKGVQVAEETLIRHRSGVLNNGSYGFNYVWEKMEYDEKRDAILMFEAELFEITYCTLGSNIETYGVRASDGSYSDDNLLNDSEKIIKSLPRVFQFQIRSLIDRHISLATNKPLEPRQRALENRKPKKSVVNYNYLTKNI